MTDAPFTLDATALSTWQSCRRRYLLYHDFLPRRWRPRSLFDRCLRRGVESLSAGAAIDEVSSAARADFMTAAASPGLDVAPGASPYAVAKDHAAMLSTTLTAISRLTLLRLSAVAAIPLNAAAAWQPLALADDSSALHRWITVSALDDDTLARELHGWGVAGDVCVSRVPLTLHVVVVGAMRAGRRLTPWIRGWRQPDFPSARVRFRRTSGRALRGDWEPAWLTDEPGHDTSRVVADWVDGLERDGVAPLLIRHVPVDVPSDTACDDVCAQIAIEAAAMRLAVAERRSAPYFAHPMSRGACDAIAAAPCVWQPCCYSPRVVDPGTLPLYQLRTRDTVLPARPQKGAQV